MSVNTVKLSQSGTLQLLHGEDVLTAGHTADLTLYIPATMSGPKRTETAKGHLWVTDRRVIFMADTLNTPGTSAAGGAAPSEPPSYDAPPSLLSLEIPYANLKTCAYNIPIFGTNSINLTFTPSPGSTLPDPGRGQLIEGKIVVGEGAGHGVWKRIEGERSRVEERGRAEEGEGLPAYEPASGPSGSGSSAPAPGVQPESSPFAGMPYKN
ncbi:hypothetical protein IAT38_007221 [Cryptococcus sp. DSM 104549]